MSNVHSLLASDQVVAHACISTGTATCHRWAEIVFGVITALVTIGLSSGNDFSRLLVTLLMVVRAALSVRVALVLWGHACFWSAVLAGLIAGVVLVMLWNARANEFFHTN